MVEHQGSCRVAQIVKADFGQAGFFQDPTEVKPQIARIQRTTDLRWKDQVILFPQVTSQGFLECLLLMTSGEHLLNLHVREERIYYNSPLPLDIYPLRQLRGILGKPKTSHMLLAIN